MSKAYRAQSPHARPAAGRAAFNLVPLAVFPIVCAATSVVPAAGLAFPAAGFLTVILYVAGYSGLAVLARQHARPEQESAGHDGQRGEPRRSRA